MLLWVMSGKIGNSSWKETLYTGALISRMSNIRKLHNLNYSVLSSL